MTRNVPSQTAQRAEPSDRPLTAYLPNFLPTFSPTSTQPSPQLSPNFLPNLNRPCLLTNMSIIWAELGGFETMSSLCVKLISSYNHPPSTPPVGIVVVFSPGPTPSKVATAHLRLGRIWSGMERESSETRSPSTIRSLDLPPFYFFRVLGWLSRAS